MNDAHRALREGTAGAHERVDALFTRFDLTERGGYAAFLGAHAEALLPLEAALDAAGAERLIDDWPARKRGALILADLAELNRRPGESRDAGLDGEDGSIAGTLYVLEGSRLGGKVLSRQLPADFPRAYLDADQPIGNWRKLLDRLDTILYQSRARATAIEAALGAFRAFERSGTFWLTKV